MSNTQPHTEEQDAGAVTRWNDYRINFLTANGWHYAGPGVYVHRVTGNEFHPYEPAPQPDGTPISQWRVLASEDRAPDPNQTHIERRRQFYDHVDNH